MNSEQPYILSGHNLWELMAKEVRRTEEKEKTKTITDILKQPDTNEEVNMGRALTSLSKGLENAFGVGLSGICGGDSAKAKLFRPHECVLCSYYGMPVELNTSVVAFDAYTSHLANQEGRKLALSYCLSCRQIYLANQRQVRLQGIWRGV